MSDIAISVENVSKQYRLGEVGTGTISHDLNRWWHKVRGKEDPYLRIGETNDRSAKSDNPYVWALQDINFEVKKGEVLGIIGKNGAGKSTLLKILSRVTSPTTGKIIANGRIASLLEVGTGFHPEMTGRENIYMNGTIMGMSRHEVRAKLDEIVEFAGVDRYLDTPVKRYSSGMTVRLGFAIAAHLDPEILIVDEVLAVGDAEFQKKAIGKMQDVSKGEGRTVLFVSHNMAAVEALCGRALLIDRGKCILQSNTRDTIEYYIKNMTRVTFENRTSGIQDRDRRGNGDARIISVEYKDENDNNTYEFDSDRSILFDFKVKANKTLEKLEAMVVVIDGGTGISVASTSKLEVCGSIRNIEENICFKVVLKRNNLQSGLYKLKLWLGDGIHNYDILEGGLKPIFIRKNIQLKHSGLGLMHLNSEVL